MRAIVNIMPGNAATAAGWRAREIRFDRSAATLGDILGSAYLKDGSTTLYELVATTEEPEGLKPEFALFVSGELLRGPLDWSRAVTDSEQLHLCDWPMIDS